MTTPSGLWRCPNLSNEDLIVAFEANPGRLRQATVGLPESDLRAHPLPGKWSIKEIVMHVVDTEIMAAGRFRQAITGSERTFPFWDQVAWTERLRYQEAGPAELDDILSLYSLLRKTSSHLLRRLSAEEWQHSGLHVKRGEMTVRILLEHHTIHCERHIQQILERRQLLGKPLAMPPITPLE